MLDNLRQDTRRLRSIKNRSSPWYVLEALLIEPGYQAVLLYRIAHWFRRHRVPLAGPLVARLSLFLTGVDISPAARIGPGLMIAHGAGIVVGGAVRAGTELTLHQQVTLGAASPHRLDEMPVLGDRVTMGAGARVFGSVTVGDRVFLGAGTLVTQDVPADSKVTCVPALEITSRRPSA